MIEIQIVEGKHDLPIVRDLFLEYLYWVNEQVAKEYGISFDMDAIVDSDMQDLSKWMPPSGRLLLASIDGEPVGVICLKALTPDCGEIKRMYIRPQARGAGVGHALVERLLVEASSIGYTQIRLDSAKFMHAAHRLYRSFGFTDISPYLASEVPAEYHQHWVFMQLDLLPTQTNSMTKLQDTTSSSAI